MGTEIKTWQIIDGKLRVLETSLKTEGRTEPYDLEPWVESNPDIIGPDIAIIGRQVMSRSGPIDLLGIDRSGNVVVVELKRDRLPREALTQAIDYASDIADWPIDKIGEICLQYSGKSLEECVNSLSPGGVAPFLAMTLAEAGPSGYDGWDTSDHGFMCWVEMDEFCRRHGILNTLGVLDFPRTTLGRLGVDRV
jgi:hypothetical protein